MVQTNTQKYDTSEKVGGKIMRSVAYSSQPDWRMTRLGLPCLHFNVDVLCHTASINVSQNITWGLGNHFITFHTKQIYWRIVQAGSSSLSEEDSGHPCLKNVW